MKTTFFNPKQFFIFSNFLNFSIMKNLTNLLTFVAFLLCTTQLFATSHTVSNNPGIPAQFTDLQVAIDQAANGDTIYVAGSGIDYGPSIVLLKRLILIGESGELNSSNVAKIPTLYLAQNSTTGTSSDGSVLLGLNFNSISNTSFNSFEANTDASNIYISSCYIRISLQGTTSSNWTITHSHVGDFFSFGLVSSNISNSIIGRLVNFYSPGSIFTNCYFYASSTNNISGEDFSIQNSIFGYNPNTPNGVSFNNNVFVSTSQPTAYDTNTPSSGNNINVSPITAIFVTASGNPINDDLNLVSTSPAIGAGIGGVDAGIYGGINPFPTIPYAPPTPQFIEFNIINPIVGQDCEIKFNSEATINN